jgi:hypothetical protein
VTNTDLGFTCRKRKSGEVQVLHRGAFASTLRGPGAGKFLSEVAASSPAEARQLVARVTGNYRRGNERLASENPRDRR